MRELLRNRNARRYLIGQSFSLFGDTAMFLAMGIWVKVLSGSNGEAGLVFFAFGAAALLSPLAGMAVDRLPRRPLLFWSNLGGGAVVLLLLLVHGRSQLWLIYLVAFLYGLVYTFLSAGQTALVEGDAPRRADRRCEGHAEHRPGRAPGCSARWRVPASSPSPAAASSPSSTPRPS